MEYDLLESELCLKADVLCDCDEEDLQRVQAKLSVINRELREVREILIKRLSRSNSSCESSCCDSEMGDARDIALPVSQPASPTNSQASSAEVEMTVFSSSSEFGSNIRETVWKCSLKELS
ncbi:hypothetical protein WJX75_000605 [Coccomyxa subellipsoidea]|uniref:Uncharacterized protein n=1 Tax=Coccomyxa subellipsoidea TaxID=248742 RepID=A0ABR2Z370_9CHLO